MTIRLFIQGKLTKLQACVILRQLSGMSLQQTVDILSMAKTDGFFDQHGREVEHL
jgi:hypothetical protein